MTRKKRTEKVKNIHRMKLPGNCFEFALIRYSASSRPRMSDGKNLEIEADIQGGWM
jgi:hypothetical protein